MRATMPFSLSTKRNSSPPRGPFLRRPSPASSPVHNEGPLKATRRSSPEIRTSPENRRSPTSPSLLLFGSKGIWLKMSNCSQFIGRFGEFVVIFKFFALNKF